MPIKGKQIADNSISQEKLKIETDSIIYDTDVTNKEYVDTIVDDQVSSVRYNKFNRNMTALNAEIGDLACNDAIIEFNLTNVRVTVNGVDQNVGPGLDCYFSPDGTIIREQGKEQKGDFLYWNSNKYTLDSSDEIDFIYLVAYDYLVEGPNSQIILDPTYKTVVVEYTGDPGTSTIVTIEDEDFIAGNVNGNFVWDIGGTNEHTFTEKNESWLQEVNGNDYTIWYDGEGSLIFSVAAGDYYIKSFINTFGENTYGQLMTGNKTDYNGAIQNVNFKNVILASGGTYHSFVLFKDGTVKAAGRNTHGELGMGNTTDYNGQVVTPPFTNVKQISCGGYHTIILFNDGTIKSFGLNGHGELGMGNTTDYNGQVVTPSFTNVTKVLASYYHTMILFDDGTIKTFGNNSNGELGMGNTTDYNGAIQTPSFTNVKDIFSELDHCFVLFNDGTVKSFGNNSHGELGMGNKTNYNGAIQTPSFTNVKTISTGQFHTYIIFNDGTVKSFGNNSFGELGMGNKTDYNGAIQTPSITNVDFAQSGSFHIIFVLNDGSVKSVGWNNNGQLGLGNETDVNGVIQTTEFKNVKSVGTCHHSVLLTY